MGWFVVWKSPSTHCAQKNGVRGEVIGLGKSGSQTLCPVFVLIERVIHLRTYNAPPFTPLSSYYTNGKWEPVRPNDITLMLKNAVGILGASLGFTKEDISARSLRASGAMALLCANVDHDRIKLVGRWRSDAMLRYLHVQAQPVMKHFAKAMITDGEFLPHSKSWSSTTYSATPLTNLPTHHPTYFLWFELAALF